MLRRVLRYVDVKEGAKVCGVLRRVLTRVSKRVLRRVCHRRVLRRVLLHVGVKEGAKVCGVLWRVLRTVLRTVLSIAAIMVSSHHVAGCQPISVASMC